MALANPGALRVVGRTGREKGSGLRLQPTRIREMGTDRNISTRGGEGVIALASAQHAKSGRSQVTGRKLLVGQLALGVAWDIWQLGLIYLSN